MYLKGVILSYVKNIARLGKEEMNEEDKKQVKGIDLFDVKKRILIV